MVDFILLLIIGSCWIWGLFAVFDEGNIFWPIRERLESYNIDYILKPLIGCPYCMGSVHGLIIGLIFIPERLLIVPFMVCLCGLNFIIKEYLYP